MLITTCTCFGLLRPSSGFHSKVGSSAYRIGMAIPIL